jgi:hypothetical protein
MVRAAADSKHSIVVPLREAETTLRFNDPLKPNCAGQFRADALDPNSSPACDSSDPTSPAWGGGNCEDHVCDVANGEAPVTTVGYSLITELDQVYDPDLLRTLCASYAGTDPTNPSKLTVEAQGFYDSTTGSCRGANWDPTKQNDEGLPLGDWCAATNSPATASCHDAFRAKFLQVFAAAPIQSYQPYSDTCGFIGL